MRLIPPDADSVAGRLHADPSRRERDTELRCGGLIAPWLAANSAIGLLDTEELDGQ